MKKHFLFFALTLTALAACNSNDGYQKAEDGLLYKKYTNKAGPKIKIGDFVAINLVVKTDSGALIANSYEKGTPLLIAVPKPSFNGDFIDALGLVTEGDSLTVKMADDSIFKTQRRPDNVKGKFITYDMKIEKVIPRGNMTEKDFRDKAMAYIQALGESVKNAEGAKIQKYIADKKLNVTKTDSGLYYTITKQGSGPRVALGDTAVIVYTGSFLNGKVFDTNILERAQEAKIVNPKREYEPIGIPIGPQKAIAGWIQGLQLLNKGATATFIIPSKLAYGKQGFGIIGGYVSLVYQIEVVNIIHPSNTKK